LSPPITMKPKALIRIKRVLLHLREPTWGLPYVFIKPLHHCSMLINLREVFVRKLQGAFASQTENAFILIA